MRGIELMMDSGPCQTTQFGFRFRSGKFPITRRRKSQQAILYSILALFGLHLMSAPSAFAGIVLEVVNQSMRYSDDKVYAQFWSGSVNGTYQGGALQTDKNYTVSDLNAGSGTVINNYTGGRIYFSVGQPINNSNGGQPETSNASVSSYSQRWDWVETTINGNSFDTMNLTTIDQFGVALRIDTLKNGQIQQTLTYKTPLGYPNAEMINKLGALSNYNPATQLYDSTTGEFLRILGPSVTPNNYPSFDKYLDAIKTWQAADPSHTTTISDLYYGATPPLGHSGPQYNQQTFKFDAKIDSATGDLIMKGTVSDPALAGEHTIRIAASELTNIGIYGANPLFSIDNAAPAHQLNDVYYAAVRDYLAGLNFGFIASTVIDPATNQPLGIEESKDWWSSGLIFDAAQPTDPFYNEWAQVVHEYSDSYGTPYSDRLTTGGKVQVTLDPSKVDTVRITILPLGLQSPPTSVPEPGSLVLVGLGAVGLCTTCLRKRKSIAA